MLIASIVLAGGRGERMGESKAALRWGDRSLLLDRVETMLDCTYPVVVVARDQAQQLPPLPIDCELAYDAIPGAGPLVAVAAGLEAVAGQSEAALVLGCDFPFVDARTLQWLIAQLGTHAGVVPTVRGEPQPLGALYRTALLPQVQALVARGERAARALCGLRDVVVLTPEVVNAFDPTGRAFANVNTREDYEQALQWRS